MESILKFPRFARRRSSRREVPTRIAWLETMERRELLALTVTVNPIMATSGLQYSSTPQKPIATILVDSTGDTAGTTLSDLSAKIVWGDGQITANATVLPDPSDPLQEFDVFGSITYTRPTPSAPNLVTIIATDTVSSSNPITAAGIGMATVGYGNVSLVPLSVSAKQGTTFAGDVAQFTSTDTNAIASEFQATIDWTASGPSTNAVVVPNPQGGFFVYGSNTYTSAGTIPFSVTLTDSEKNVLALTTGSATVAPTTAPSVLNSVGQLITATAGQPLLNAFVGSFTDSKMNNQASDLKAVISWGDGNTSIGMIIPDSNLTTGVVKGYDVEGSNTYETSGSDVVTIVVQDESGDTTTINSTARVVDSGLVFTGSLAPTSDTGSMNKGIYTNTDRPSLSGKTTPFSVVQLSAQIAGLDATIPLGQTVAGPSGEWLLTVGPLLDGYYTVSATVTTPGGYPTPTGPLANNGLLVVDTANPVVVSVLSQVNSNKVVVTFRDGLSGLDLQTLLNASNYSFVGPRGIQIRPLAVSLQTVGILPTDPVSVVLTTTNNPRLRGRLTEVRIINSGVSDLAGNKLQGTFQGVYAPIASKSHSKITRVVRTHRR